MPNNRRNWVARAAIMKKGGVHDKSNKAKRQKAKQAFKRKLKQGAEQFGSFLQHKYQFKQRLLKGQIFFLTRFSLFFRIQ